MDPRRASHTDAARVIDDALETVSGGRPGGCLLLEAAESHGRTRLVDHATGVADALGMSVVRGRATELDRAAPLSTLTALLTQLSRLAVSDAELTVTVEDTAATTSRLAGHLTALARERPLAVLLDDVHDADELSALALRLLVPATAGAPILWLLTRRITAGDTTGAVGNPEDFALTPGDRAANVLTERHARCIGLAAALDNDDVEDLCVQVLAARPGPRLAALAGCFRGTPGLVGALLSTLHREGRLVHDAGEVELAEATDPVELPADFGAAVSTELAALPESCRRILVVGTILGRPFTLHEVSAVLGRSVPDLLCAATQLVTEGHLLEDRNGLDIRNEIVATTVRASLTPAVRRAMHREAARVVQEEGGSAVEAAEQLLRAGHVCGSALTGVLRTAMAELSSGPGTDASDTAMRLVRLVPGTSKAVARTAAEMMRLLTEAGRPDRAGPLGQRVLEEIELDGAEPIVLRALAEIATYADADSMVGHIRRILDRGGMSDGARAELLAEQAHALADSGVVLDAEAPAREALELGERERRPVAVTLAAAAAGATALRRGDLADAHELAARAVTSGDAAGAPALARMPRAWLVPTLVALDRFDEAEDAVTRCFAEAEAVGLGWAHRLAHLQRAELRLAQGRLDAAAADAEAGLAAADSCRFRTVVLLALLGEIDVHRGDLDSARRRFDEGENHARTLDPDQMAPFAWRRAVMLDAQERTTCATHWITQFLRASSPAAALPPGAAGMVVRLAKQGGLHREAERLVDAVTRLAERNPGVVSLAGGAAHARGVLRDDVAALRDAVGMLRSGPRPPALATALTDAGLAEGRVGRVQERRSALDEAQRIWRDMAAVRDDRWVETLLRPGYGDPAGPHPEPPTLLSAPPSLDPPGSGPDRAAVGDRAGAPGRGVTVASSAWSDLTPAEMRVVTLVSQGKTNREVASRLSVSPHTVDSHLRRSFAKLEVTSRVELTRMFLTSAGEPGDVPG